MSQSQSEATAPSRRRRAALAKQRTARPTRHALAIELAGHQVANPGACVRELRRLGCERRELAVEVCAPGCTLRRPWDRDLEPRKLRCGSFRRRSSCVCEPRCARSGEACDGTCVRRRGCDALPHFPRGGAQLADAQRSRVSLVTANLRRPRAISPCCSLISSVTWCARLRLIGVRTSPVGALYLGWVGLLRRGCWWRAVRSPRRRG